MTEIEWGWRIFLAFVGVFFLIGATDIDGFLPKIVFALLSFTLVVIAAIGNIPW